ncbi:MAG: imidazole glycerol phosphate synthase subunit HisH [Oscillospiraceae bacterium]|nr:imidazole glycerol phosphate synthase subunit HisH [Oscillospiraceae bacterium]
MIVIVDYGVGNLFSLKSSFAMIGAPVLVSGDEKEISAADKIILPGVGAFGDAAESLRRAGLDEALKRAAGDGKPILGICLGMQMLFDRSFEYGEHRGLGLIPGSVVDMRPKINRELKVPHIGWNALHLPKGPTGLFKYINENDHAYFVHSYYADCDSRYITASTEYDIELTAAVARDNVMGCQFHPEKSGRVGLSILRAFCEM